MKIIMLCRYLQFAANSQYNILYLTDGDTLRYEKNEFKRIFDELKTISLER